MDTEGGFKMNDLTKWLDDHEEIELLIFERGDSVIVQMTDMTTSFKIKQQFPKNMLRMYFGPAEYVLAFDNLYERLKMMHKIGIMMEE